MKKNPDLVEIFDRESRTHHRLHDLEPEVDLIREEKEYQDGLFRVLLEAKINFKRNK